jgi:hypothetical protein
MYGKRFHLTPKDNTPRQCCVSRERIFVLCVFLVFQVSKPINEEVRSMNTALKTIAITGFVVLAAGCSTTKALQGDVASLKEQVSSLQADVTTLKSGAGTASQAATTATEAQRTAQAADAKAEQALAAAQAANQKAENAAASADRMFAKAVSK